MSFFDRFQKKTQTFPTSPVADTMCLLLMDRTLNDIDVVAAHLKSAFGDQAVGEISYDHPHVLTFTVTVDGFEFWCSYLSMPIPADTADIPTAAQYSFLLTDEEKQAFVNHKSFWMLAQKGGGTTLETKREVCWKFSLLCAALLELDGAVGVHIVNRGGLLISKRQYFGQRELMEGKKPTNDEGYFPSPLWVWVYGTHQGKAFIIQTTGLRDFGLPELGFYEPKQYSTEEYLDFLYTMSAFQITGRQLYRNAAVIPLDEKTEVVCKQEGDILFFFGA